jgi:RING finger protein 113A
MFRKPKRKLKDSIRRKDEDESLVDRGTDDRDAASDDDNEGTKELLRVRSKREKTTGRTIVPATSSEKNKDSLMHTYEAKVSTSIARDLATSTAEHHPTVAPGTENDSLIARNDGIFRGDKVRNKFLAGPIRAAAHVRVTARFDYQPDVCKDYKETGFCGYGDTCIYLHDRGDTVSGWQLERQWEEQQKLKKAKQEQEMNNFATGKFSVSEDGALNVDDGIPFACHICREQFKEPVATNCLHYFCEPCIMNHVRTVSDACPVCGKDTGSVFNFPSKLISKKRKVLGTTKSQDDDSWEKYFISFQGGQDK